MRIKGHRDWVKGIPAAHGWYLFAWRANTESGFQVGQMWYGPEGFRFGGGYMGVESTPVDDMQIVAWRHLPIFNQLDKVFIKID